MKKNIGAADRILRVLVAAAIIVIYFTTSWFGGTLTIILLALSGIFILTGITGICPLYLPFGISTCRAKVHG